MGVGVLGLSQQAPFWQQAPQYASVVPQYPHCEQQSPPMRRNEKAMCVERKIMHLPYKNHHNLLEHGLFGPHTAVFTAQFPGFDVALVVVDVVSVVEEVVIVAPVPSEVDVVVVELGTKPSGAMHA